MHPYSINSKERSVVPLFLAVLAIILSYLLHLFSDKVFKIPWWIEAPSVIGFYGILYNLFDKYFWKYKMFSKLGLVKTPVICGVWSGNSKSSANYENGNKVVKVEIRQSWTSIKIFLETDTSESLSFEASIVIDQFNTPRLYYQYQNNPKDSAPGTMHTHFGSVHASIKDSKTIEAEYYSGRDRNNTGTFLINKN